eukprot:GEMP01017216.1.p1 GENE.GEMP01017216.1~~GEMP01017216.1.p1  ORF type:complete len:737 (+),score=140.69 GEMP01017216.1:158-2212(+)
MNIASKLSVIQRVERAFEAQIVSPNMLRVSIEEPDYETFKPATQVLTRVGNCIFATQQDPQVKFSLFHPGGREFRVVERENKTDKKLALEIWTMGQLEKRKWVGKAFGPEVYTGGIFGSPRWSQDMSKVIFIAEKKKPEFNNYWSEEQSEQKDGPELKFKRGLGPGGNDFGEMLLTKTDPTLCVYDLAKNQIDVVKQSMFGEGDIFPCHPTFAPDGSIVCAAFDLRQSGRVGLIACLNRNTKLYHLKDMESPAVSLTDDYFFAMVPRFSPDGKSLVFFTHKEPFLGHSTAFSLSHMAWPVSTGSTPITTLADDIFYGFHDDMAKSEFLNDSTMAVQTAALNALKVALVSLDGDVTAVEDPTGTVGSNTLLNVGKDTLIISRSDFRSLTSLWTYTVSQKKWEEEPLRPSPQDRVENAAEILQMLKDVEVHDVALANGAAAMLLLPKNDAPVPLILKLHGGPHSHALNAFSAETALFLSMGFAVLIPNYRGSIGATKSFCDELIGYIGDKDVDDCEQLTLRALADFSTRLSGKVVSYGGSHGGFLTGWLLGRNVVPLVGGVLWNPVTNLVAQLSGCEIPEWVTAEALKTGTRRAFDEGDIQKMWEKSPISVAHKVKVPVLMVLGGDDRRVPPYNGREFVQALSGLDRSQISQLEFPDQGHALKGKEANCYAVVNICEWIANRFSEK